MSHGTAIPSPFKIGIELPFRVGIRHSQVAIPPPLSRVTPIRPLKSHFLAATGRGTTTPHMGGVFLHDSADHPSESKNEPNVLSTK